MATNQRPGDFYHDLERGKIGERLARRFLEEYAGGRVEDVTDLKEWQDVDIDFLVYSADGSAPTAVEVKTQADARHNVFLEVDAFGKTHLGALFKSQADRWLIWLSKRRQALYVPLQPLRAWTVAAISAGRYGGVQTYSRSGGKEWRSTGIAPRIDDILAAGIGAALFHLGKQGHTTMPTAPTAEEDYSLEPPYLVDLDGRMTLIGSLGQDLSSVWDDLFRSYDDASHRADLAQAEATERLLESLSPEQLDWLRRSDLETDLEAAAAAAGLSPDQIDLLRRAL